MVVVMVMVVVGSGQCFFQDLGQGGAKRQYVIWWGAWLSQHANLPVPRGGESEPRGGKCSPPAPPLKETLDWWWW